MLDMQLKYISVKVLPNTLVVAGDRAYKLLGQANKVQSQQVKKKQVFMIHWNYIMLYVH